MENVENICYTEAEVNSFEKIDGCYATVALYIDNIFLVP